MKICPAASLYELFFLSSFNFHSCSEENNLRYSQRSRKVNAVEGIRKVVGGDKEPPVSHLSKQHA